MTDIKDPPAGGQDSALNWSDPAVALLPLEGCGPAKLDISMTYIVVPGDSQFVILPAKPKPQRFVCSGIARKRFQTKPSPS